MEFWKSASLLIPAQNIDSQHFFFSLSTTAIEWGKSSTAQQKSQWMACCENPQLIKHCFKTVSNVSTKLSSDRKHIRLHTSFTSPIDMSQSRPVSLVHLMAYCCYLLASCYVQNKFALSHSWSCLIQQKKKKKTLKYAKWIKLSNLAVLPYFLNINWSDHGDMWAELCPSWNS